MPTNIIPVSTFTEPVVVPVGGDARTAASVETGFQALTNRSEKLKDILESGFELRIFQQVLETSEAILEAVSSASYVDVTGITTPITVLSGDKILSFASFGFIDAGTAVSTEWSAIQFRIARSSASQAIGDLAGAEALLHMAVGPDFNSQRHLTMFGFEEATFSEVYTVKCQAKRLGGTGAVNPNIYKLIHFLVVVVRPTGALP